MNNGWFKKGQKVWNSGKPGYKIQYPDKRKLKGNLTKEHREKIIQSIPRGENHKRWKGGIYPLHEKIRKLFEYRQWRSDIFTRDNWTCQNCGKRGCKIEADHFPKRFSTILEENKIKTIEEARDCEKLWDINNGRTLCLNCHKPTGGRRKN